jgi:S-adenosylmethionine:tRNA ribosyltransferase-isomerase
LIAQTPVEPRDSARLLVLHRDTAKIEHTTFHEVGKFLRRGDLLVLNQTRVIPARIFARKQTGGRIEVLLLKREDATTWESLVGGKGLGKGKQLTVEAEDISSSQKSSSSSSPTRTKPGEIKLEVEILEVLDGSRRRVRFSEPIEPYFPIIGHVPLPPYIHEKLADPERYQTVYASQPGSAAAPTAGLHFTPRLLEVLHAEGIALAYVTLHVGLDTFAPVTEDDPAQHKIHTEWCELPEITATAVQKTRQAGGRVIAVGTTSVRTLESATGQHGVEPFYGDTRLFITPGYQFMTVDGMITNFHLPKSTLIMLVSAFAGLELTLQTYETAKRTGYRFYSFGDAMLIL